jgi:hypothetical protein
MAETVHESAPGSAAGRSRTLKLVLGIAVALIAVTAVLVGVSFYQATRWSPVVSGVDGSGTKWTAYVTFSPTADSGTFISIAPPGKAGSKEQFIQAGPFLSGCQHSGCMSSDQIGINGEIDYGFVPPDTVAVVVSPGKRVAAHSLPAIPFWMPNAKLFVYVHPAADRTSFVPYAVDRDGKKLPYYKW